MRAYGVTYDTGFVSAGSTTHEPFDPETVRTDMRTIRDVLRCDAVRITGGVAERLEIAARHAADAGLEVWYCPFTNGLTQTELLEFLTDAAVRAERLRAGGATVVFLTGSEISLFTHGFVAGDDIDERAAVLSDPARARTELPAVPGRVNAFLGRAVAAARERFSGTVGYASLPFEGIDWAPFDVVATDAGYRDATMSDEFFEQGLRSMLSAGKPLAVTEFGCVAHRGAADLGSRGYTVVELDRTGRPVRLEAGLVRDEEEQARYLRQMLDAYDAGGVDTAFVHTFAYRYLPTSGDPARDYDLASFGVVKVLPDDPRAWEPKAAFHALAEYGRLRSAPGDAERSS